MANLMECPICGAPDQEVDKYCEHCGGQVLAGDGEPAASAASATPAPAAVAAPATISVASAVSAPIATASSAPAYAPRRFIRVHNGVLKPEDFFDVPVGSRMLVGRMDPTNGVFPEVDVTRWASRVKTPDGLLYTIHRQQCYISRDDDGRIWIVDYPTYVGDTLVAPVGSTQYKLIPALSEMRDSNHEGAVALEIGDRILMGQAEGILMFALMEG
ncbi:MAG: hypothetical protein ACPGWR_29885 [Ardenticatenaceae bacterium]